MHFGYATCTSCNLIGQESQGVDLIGQQMGRGLIVIATQCTYMYMYTHVLVYHSASAGSGYHWLLKAAISPEICYIICKPLSKPINFTPFTTAETMVEVGSNVCVGFALWSIYNLYTLHLRLESAFWVACGLYSVCVQGTCSYMHTSHKCICEAHVCKMEFLCTCICPSSWHSACMKLGSLYDKSLQCVSSFRCLTH